MSIELKINGFTEFQESLEKVVKAYPDKTAEFLTDEGKKYKKLVISKTPSSKIQSKQKLVKSYHVSKIKGYGLDIEVEFYSKSPHFHLIERGHKTTSGGWVEGRYMNEKSSNEFKETYIEDIEKFIDECLKEVEK